MSKEEVDDPIFALLTSVTRHGLIRPQARERGSFEPPEADAEEPGRTERHLSRFFSLRLLNPRHVRAGDALAELQTWLGDASGSARGLWYQGGSTALQLTSASLMGFTYAMAWSQSPTGSKVRQREKSDEARCKMAWSQSPTGIRVSRMYRKSLVASEAATLGAASACAGFKLGLTRSDVGVPGSAWLTRFDLT